MGFGLMYLGGIGSVLVKKRKEDGDIQWGMGWKEPWILLSKRAPRGGCSYREIVY